ncbi:MAG: hypothetical protein GY720_04650 [bacterium]|nr:hypothetical protein [bacterium]
MAHDGLLSAAEDAAGTQADLYDTTDAANQAAGIFTGAILFSMGCHSGLNVSDVQVGATPDWAQEFSELGAVYAAETGFGYGDTEFLAYGEELMRQFAFRLNGTATIGQAMGFAKQYHAANLSQYSPYDEKVIMETVVYGLPFYSVGEAAVPPPAPVVPPAGTDAPTGLPVLTTSFDYGDGTPGADGQFDLVTGSDRGDFYTADGEAQVTAFNPIQPKAMEDVTQPGLTGTGVFISELTSVDKPGFDPVFSRPTVDLADREPELSLPGTFPIVLPGINSFVDRTGDRDQLVVVLGQFTDTDGIGEEGVERLFTHVEANVLYGDPADQLLPTIRSVKATDTGAGGFLSFDVDAFDLDGSSATATDVERVYVLYKLVNVDGVWSQLDLTKVSSHPDASWVGTVSSLGAKVEFIVQAIDSSGLVAVHSNKTAGNESVEAPAPQPGGLDIVVAGGPVDPVYTTDPVLIDIIGGDENDPIEVDVDGEGFEPYDGTPIPVSGEGPHTVTVTDGTEEDSVTFIIDTMAPDIFISSPVDGALYETGSLVTASYSCTDAGVGVASCNGSVADGATIDTSAPGIYSVSVSSQDGLGNSSAASATYEVADPLVLTVAPTLVPQQTPVNGTVQFTPDLGHGHTATWDWGDGSVDVCTASDCLDAAGGTSSRSHVYGQAGVFQVVVTVVHDGSGSQVAESDFVVVYDSTGRFVIGKGEIESPFGSFTPQDEADPEVTGTLEFGFTAKYKKNGTMKGKAGVELETEDMSFEFESTDLEWLVSSGAKAWVKGVGEIEDWAGEFEFLIQAIDAQEDSGDAFDKDTFRIRIWQDDGSAEGRVVYDSGYFAPLDDPALGTTELAWGKIKIKDRGWIPR